MFVPLCGSGFRSGLYQHGKWNINTINPIIKVKKYMPSNILWLRLILRPKI